MVPKYGDDILLERYCFSDWEYHKSFFFGVLAAQPGGVTQQEAAMRRLSHARGVGRCPRGESAAARAGRWRGVGRCPRAESAAARAGSRFGRYIARISERHFGSQKLSNPL